MTLPQNWEDSYYDQEEAPDAWAELQPVPVEIKRTEIEQVAPESTSWMFYNIPLAPALAGTGALQPVQICTHKYHRHKAKFLWTIPANCVIYLDRVQDRLMANALGTTFQIITGATAITSSAVILPEYDGQQALYAVATVAGATVSVMDESYKTVQ
jgi:hypothetical protein